MSDLTKLDWITCWQLNIYEFFNYVTFSREYNRRHEEMKKQIREKYRR